MSIDRVLLRYSALLIVATALSACAPVPPREDAIASGVATSNWKAGQVFSNNIGFEQTPKRTRFGNGLEIALRKAGWFTTSPTANYRLSYQMVSETMPKKFSVGSEGSLGISYVLKDSSQTIVWSGTVYSFGKLSFQQSLLGAEGVSQVVEAYANDNLKQLFARLEAAGTSLYDKQQAKLADGKLAEAFNSYDLFSETSFFENKPYSSLNSAARTTVLTNTRTTWLKKLKGASAQNRQKFLDTYGAYLDSNDKAEVTTLINQKKTQPPQANEPHPAAPKSTVVEHKNPF